MKKTVIATLGLALLASGSPLFAGHQVDDSYCKTHCSAMGLKAEIRGLERYIDQAKNTGTKLVVAQKSQQELAKQEKELADLKAELAKVESQLTQFENH